MADPNHSNSGTNRSSGASGLGKGMIIAAWLVLLVLLYFLFQNVLTRQYNPNQEVSSDVSDDNTRIVTLKRNRRGHYVATGIINNHPVQLILDTGATDVSVPAKLASKLKLKKGLPVKTVTANGVIETYLTNLGSVQLGDIRIDNVRANINPYSSEVLLGMSFLKQLEFTQRGDTLTLKQYQ